MSKKIEESIEMIVKPIIEDAGYEYVGTEIKNAGDAKELIIYADLDGRLSLQDCEKISRMIDPAIDQYDPIEDAYYLCVSSPGIDRPLKTATDFARSIGKKIDVKLYSAINGEKTITGFLKAFDDYGFTINLEEKEITFAYKDTAIVRMHVDL